MIKLACEDLRWIEFVYSESTLDQILVLQTLGGFEKVCQPASLGECDKSLAKVLGAQQKEQPSVFLEENQITGHVRHLLREMDSICNRSHTKLLAQSRASKIFFVFIILCIFSNRCASIKFWIFPMFKSVNIITFLFDLLSQAILSASYY